ncbi:MAG: NAD-dependent epimerase/dehydratase family protein [Solirubrobacteraceae bacterium]
MGDSECEVGAIARYLITGGAGFIGSHLADAFVAKGEEVAILDNLSTGRRANVEHLLASGAAELIEGCVTDVELVDTLMGECDRCIHLASTVGVQLVIADALEALRNIVCGADVVISAAADHGKRVLFMSTSEVYGKSSNGRLREDSDRVFGSLFKSRWSYAIAKSYGETLAYGYHREHGADTRVARLFNTIGPRQVGDHGMVVPRLVRQAIAGEELTVFGDGSQTRCFLDVHDAVSAIIGLSEHDRASGGAFNIGSVQPIAVRALAQRIVERARSSSRIKLVPYEEVYDEGFEELGQRSPDLTALRRLTGWSPRRTLDQALDDVIAFQRAELVVKA